eukprot:TRINITY_DN19169_c0_g1_i1.p1 TRINITY_DN19169_c0_g1~~TRINITY_DN19169_c0_g1_i1.p1  ORF type:complete len:176 (+),score=30.46 TRINITY_DN19169_c0_g1_i1:275-802(+)
MSTSAAKGQTDLLDQIEWPSVECLNESSEHPVANALKQGYRDDDGLVLESDADEQILLTIPFQQVVKLHSLGLKAPSDSGPKKVKLFTNRTSLGFSEATDGLVPQQEIVFTAEQLDGTPIPLKYVKFQGVRSLTIFVESNQEDEDTTKIQKIVLLGSTVETTDMKALKKVEEHQH